VRQDSRLINGSARQAGAAKKREALDYSLIFAVKSSPYPENPVAA
jgi:hypothetical protein